jgi:protease I
VTAFKALPDDYDALVIPGGVMNPDKMRMNRIVWNLRNISWRIKNQLQPSVMALVMVETGMMKGRDMTSYYSIKTDIQNAGAHWHDWKL